VNIIQILRALQHESDILSLGKCCFESTDYGSKTIS